MRRAILLVTLTATFVVATPSATAQIHVTCSSPTSAPCNDFWHREPVRIHWRVDAPFVAAVGSCVDETIDWDTGGAARSCTATAPGDELTRKVTVQLDSTAPVVTGSAPSRGPDVNGWYRSPLQVSFAGADALSGVLGCSSGTYSGPDAAAAQVLGRCWDRAGNVSAPGTFDLRYDATAPSLARVTASGRDHKVRLEWAVPDAVDVDLQRGDQRLLSGGPSGSLVDRRLRNGHRYQYVVSATDAAGNTAKRTLTVVPGPRLLGPRAGVALDHPPLLRWTRIRGADYYNVQVFRGRRKVLSAWPTRPRLRLAAAWRYAGHKRRLKPGRRYRWFVWPGEGARPRNEYGRLIGGRTFVITP
jgi:hypothetical protein